MVVLEERSKITDKGQTTVPKRIRDRLGVSFGDEIVYRVNDDGSILVESAEHSAEEAAVDAFLEFISNDIKRRPEALHPFDAGEMEELLALVEGIEVDLDDDFSGARPI